MAIPVAAYMAGASLLGGLFSKKKKVSMPAAPDISGELAKLDALYGTQRELLTKDIAQQTGQMQRQTAQGLANRGIFSSPVSEASFSRTRQTGQQALSQGLSDLYGQQASARSAALNSLLQYNQNIQMANYQRQLQQQQQQSAMRSGLFGMAGSFGLQALQGLGGNGGQQSSPLSFANPQLNVANQYMQQQQFPQQSYQTNASLYKNPLSLY